MVRGVRAAALLVVAIAIVLLSSSEGRAQEAESTVTITIDADGAAPEETFPITVDIFETSEILELDLLPDTPVMVDVAAGFASIFERVPVGWAFGGLSCTGPEPFMPLEVGPSPPDEPPGAYSLTVPAGINVDCVVTNTAAPTGTVRISRTIDGTDPNPSAEHQVWAGQADQQVLPANATIDVVVNAGRAGVTDVPAEEYGTFIIDCGDAVVARFGPQVVVDVAAGGTVECTVVNVANPVATLRIEKLTEQDSGELQFPFRVGDIEFDVEPSFAAGFGGVEFALGPGPYEFIELSTDGWFLQSIGCSGIGIELIDQGVRIAPEQGGNVECTFVNALINEAPELGDVNCDGIVDIIDALVIAQFDARVRQLGDRCPLTDPAGEIWAPTADVDASGTIDILDALAVARCSAGLPSPLCPDL